MPPQEEGVAMSTLRGCRGDRTRGVESVARWAALLALAWAAAQPVHAQERFRFESTPGRLSKDVVPVGYQLVLDLDPARDTFDGRVEIEVRLRKPTDAIELHAHELQATRAQLVSGTRSRTLTVTPDADAQIWRLAPADNRPIGGGTHRIAIDYAGKVQRQGQALYRATATIEGQPQPSLATQLEPIHARRL